MEADALKLLSPGRDPTSLNML